MIAPDKVFDSAKKKEKENYKFRAFLKNHADEDVLDAQFLKLHNELFENYDCSKCRNCCKMLSAEIPQNEIQKDSAFLGISTDDFIEKYLLPDKYGISYKSKHTPCVFLTDNGDCLLGDCKPESCKNYPHTNKPERMRSLLSFIENVSICPVVYEICERLKKEYNFK